MRLTTCLLALVLLALCLPAGAAPSLLGPTGLLLIPTAETVGLARFDFGATGISTDEGPDESALFANVGLLPSLEVGASRVKVQGVEAETLINAKLRVFQPPVGKFTVSAGFLDLTDQIGRSPYLVLSHALGAGVVTQVGPITLPQLHVGVGGGQFDGLFAGVSTTINRRVNLMAEYDSEHFNVGASLPLATGLEAKVAALDGFKDFAGSVSFSAPW